MLARGHPGRVRRGYLTLHPAPQSGTMDGMEPHASLGIAECLRTWGCSPTSSAASAARSLFPDLDAFRAFFDIITPGSNDYEESRYGGEWDFAYTLTAAHRLMSKVIFPDRAAQVRRVAAYIRILRDSRYNATGLTADETARGYARFSGDVDYALAALPDGYRSNEMNLVFPVVERYRLAGVPAEYVGSLRVAEDMRFWHEWEAKSLVEAGVPGKYAWKLRGFETADILVMHENGVEAQYAIKVHRSMNATDASAVCLLWREDVELGYVLAGLNAGLDAEGILRYHDEDIPAEYMVRADV